MGQGVYGCSPPRPRSAWHANPFRRCGLGELPSRPLSRSSPGLAFADLLGWTGSSGVVLLLVLPHPQHGGRDHARQAELRERRLGAAVEEPLIAGMDGILVALRDHRRRGALEDALLDAIVLAGEASRLRNTCLDPASVGRLDPVRARASHDAEAAIAPELSLRSEAVGRDDNRNQACCADRSKAGCCPQDCRHPRP